MGGRTDFITDARWEDVWTIWYTFGDDAYRVLEQHYRAWRRSGPQTFFSDSEAISVGLIWRSRSTQALVFAPVLSDPLSASATGWRVQSVSYRFGAADRSRPTRALVASRFTGR